MNRTVQSRAFIPFITPVQARSISSLVCQLHYTPNQKTGIGVSGSSACSFCEFRPGLRRNEIGARQAAASHSPLVFKLRKVVEDVVVRRHEDRDRKKAVDAKRDLGQRARTK